MTKQILANVAKYVEAHGCVPVVRRNRVEFSLIYFSSMTGELVEEVLAAATVEDARSALER